MAGVLLVIDDAATRLTLKSMLEAKGHTAVNHNPDAVITDDVRQAEDYASQRPTLLLATAAQVPQAVSAMKHGVFGYVFVPLQPDEAVMMLERAIAVNGVPGKTPQMDVASLEDVELRHILDVLRQSKFNQARAARALGIGRNTLWRKLKKARERGLIDDGGRPMGLTG